MRNAIKYYYNIDVDNLKYRNNEYLFDNYILKELKRDLDINLYNFFTNNNRYIHHIIFNKQGSYITSIDNKQYILLEKSLDVDIDMRQIKEFLIDINVSEKKNWALLWSNKVDYYEKNIIRIKNKEVLEVFPYYIGLSELAIRLYKEAPAEGTYSVCHDRLNCSNDFYSPDNIITDYKVRDIAEYIKITFFEGSIDLDAIFQNLDQLFLTPADFFLLYVRLLFPTYFFDCLETGEDILIYSSKINQYEQLLNDFYYYLKRYVDIPKIDWLIKKV